MPIKIEMFLEGSPELIKDCEKDEDKVYGTLKNGKTSLEVDNEIFSNKSYERIYENSIKLQLQGKINFILVNLPWYFAYDDDYNIIKDFKSKYKEKIKNSVNVFFFGNISGGEHMPLTPWMIFHRMSHADYIGENSNNSSIYTDTIEKEFLYQKEFLSLTRENYINDYVYKFISDMGLTSNKYMYGYRSQEKKDFVKFFKNSEYLDNFFNAGEDHIFEKFKSVARYHNKKSDDWAKYIFPFKSTNSCRLFVGDILAELFAQKFICGKISLQKVTNIPDDVVPPENKELLMEKYKEYENKLNIIYDTIIKNIFDQNKTLVF